ncbi:MAG TPA: hypothetical protein VGI45_29820 [Terracidiphilus sp.]
MPRSESIPTLPDIDVRLEPGRDGIHILLNQKLVAIGGTVLDAALATIKALDDAVVHRLKKFRAVHAGAVLVEGSALLVPGSTHAGKSSLVAELLRRGALCFSDEYALIDNQGRVHAYPRPLLLRKGRPKQSPCLPEELNSKYAAGHAPVGWIFAIDYASGGEWGVNGISQSEAVTLLLRNTPHEMAEEPEMVDIFIRASASATCYAGTRGDASEAVTRIFHLIGHK